MTTAHTTASGMEAARAILRGNWDDNGTESVYLPVEFAARLLEQRGWTLNISGYWISPVSSNPYLSAGDALQAALLAEVAA